MEHFFDKNSYKICLRRIFSKACSSNASKMHKIGYMRPPRGSPDASRTAQDGFCLRFGCQLEAKLAPCWPLFPLKTVPRRLQDVQKSIKKIVQKIVQNQNRKSQPVKSESGPEITACEIRPNLHPFSQNEKYPIFTVKMGGSTGGRARVMAAGFGPEP